MTGLLKQTYEDSEDDGDFYSRLKTTITKHHYEQFLNVQGKDFITIGDWLQVYNAAERRLCNTIVVRFMYAKTQLVSQVDVHTEQIQKAFFTFVQINEKSFRSVVAMVP